MGIALLETGQQILFAHTTYNGTALGDLEQGTATVVALDLTGVQTAEAESSAKADLGANRATEFAVQASIEFETAPVTGQTVDFYWAPSVASAAATGNPGYVTGASAAYAGGAATLGEGLKQLMFLGSMVCSADFTTTVQTAHIGTFSPPTRYGTLIVHNATDDDFLAADAIEMAVSFTPIVRRG